MRYSEPAPTTSPRTRIRWTRVTALVVVVAAIATALGLRHPASSSSRSTAASPIHLHRGHRGPPGAPSLRRGDGAVAGSRPAGALGESDGAIPDGTTVFADRVPGVDRLDPTLLRALRQAAAAAAGGGVEFLVDSGWRSAAYQQHLLREAISKYGSEAEAARWVAQPNASAHVSGDAVDLGSAAASWLREHGATYGLCQIYANEPWHFELRREAVDRGCPAMYADPTQDPRMQR